MNRRIVTLALAIVMLLLTGCQLAVPNAESIAQSETENTTKPDRLTGFFVTTDYLGESNVYDWSDLDHAAKMMYDLNAQDVESSANISSGSLFDGKTSISTTDANKSVKHSGCIYVSCNSDQTYIYIHPIYQAENGESYLAAGECVAIDGTLGYTTNRTLSGEHTYESDGTKNTFAYSAEITIECIETPDKVVFIQMDENHQELREDEYLIDRMPEKIVAEENAAYILVKEYYPNNKIRRSISQPGDDTIEVLRCRENNICENKQIKVVWPKAEEVEEQAASDSLQQSIS